MLYTLHKVGKKSRIPVIRYKNISGRHEVSVANQQRDAGPQTQQQLIRKPSECSHCKTAGPVVLWQTI